MERQESSGIIDAPASEGARAEVGTSFGNNDHESVRPTGIPRPASTAVARAPVDRLLRLVRV